MRTSAAAVVVIVLFAMPATSAGDTISLFDYAFNLDGTLSQAPSQADTSGFNFGTGLGTISVSIGGAGDHYVALFLDHEIVESENTFFNEFGGTGGTLASGQGWEIDEPGWVFGNIYDNLIAGSLDSDNAVPSSAPDDVSMALSWNFLLAENETATISFLVSTLSPSSGFYLSHTDPDSNATIYFSSTIDITGGPVIPTPSSVAMLVGLGLMGVLGARARKKRG